jgi:hypothetical protein
MGVRPPGPRTRRGLIPARPSASRLLRGGLACVRGLALLLAQRVRCDTMAQMRRLLGSVRTSPLGTTVVLLICDALHITWPLPLGLAGSGYRTADANCGKGILRWP